MVFTCEDHDPLIQTKLTQLMDGYWKFTDPLLYFTTSGISHTTSWKENKVVNKKYVQVANGFHVWKPWPPSTNTTHANRGRELTIERPIAAFYRPPIFQITTS